MGTRARARAGADVAVGDSALSQVNNPATLTLSPKIRLDGELGLGISSAHWNGPVDSATSDRRLFPFTNWGAAFPITDRLSLGTAFESRAGSGTSFKYRALGIPADRRYKSDLKVGSVPISLAYKVTDRLSIGGGGRVEVASARVNLPLGTENSHLGRGYAYGGGFQLGAHWQARDDLAFGLAYRSPSWFTDMEGGEGKVGGAGVRWPMQLGPAKVYDFELPQRISGGLAWDVTKRLKLVSEMRWINWDNSTLHKATTHTDRLREWRIPLGYHDQWAFIQAAQYKLTDNWNAACGYHYATQVVSRANLTPMTSPLSRHHVACGLWYERPRWWVGGAYELALPESMSGPGYSKIPLGWDYGYGELSQTVHVMSVGFGVRW